MAEEVKLMKGNVAIAHAAIRNGVDGYFGYPITPQSEILETLTAEERYLLLMERQPEIFQRVPLKYIASYLNIEAPSLSRLRSRLLKKK